MAQPSAWTPVEETLAWTPVSESPGALSRFAEGTGIPSLVRAISKSGPDGEDPRATFAKNLWELAKSAGSNGPVEHLKAAQAAAKSGDYLSAIHHVVSGAAANMGLGPAEQMTSQILGDLKSGNIAGAVGGLATVFGPTAIEEAGQGLKGISLGNRTKAAAMTARDLGKEAVVGEVSKIPGVSTIKAGLKTKATYEKNLASLSPTATPPPIPPPVDIIAPSGVTGSGRPIEGQYQSLPPEYRMPFDPARLGPNWANANPNAGPGVPIPQPPTPKGPTSRQVMPDRVITDPATQIWPNANPNAGGTGRVPPSSPSRIIRPDTYRPRTEITPSDPLPTPAEAGFGGPNPEPLPRKTSPAEAANRASLTDRVAATLYNGGKGVGRDKISLLRDPEVDPMLKNDFWESVEKAANKGKPHSEKSRTMILNKLEALHDEAAKITPASPVPEP